jgi:hypothetical protein
MAFKDPDRRIARHADRHFGKLHRGSAGKGNEAEVQRRRPEKNAEGSKAQVGEDQGRIYTSEEGGSEGGQTEAQTVCGRPEGDQRRSKEAVGGEEGCNGVTFNPDFGPAHLKVMYLRRSASR